MGSKQIKGVTAVMWQFFRHMKTVPFFTNIYGIGSFYPRVLILTLGINALSNMKNLIVRKGNMAQTIFQPQNGSEQVIIYSL